MGLFSSKYVTTVASVLYNMAGDEADRINYLHTAVASAVLSPANVDIGASVVNTHLTGPGTKQKAFYRWARSNFDMGMPTATLRASYNLDGSLVAAEIPAPAGSTVEIQSTYIESANSQYYAEQLILEDYPLLVETEWTSEYNLGSDSVTITFEDTTTFTFPLVGYTPDQDFIIAYYHEEVTATGALGPLKLFIYVLGGANANLNALENPANVIGEFYPFIPLRINNKAIDHADYIADGTYDLCKKAYKRGAGNSLDTVLGSIEDNPQIGDIDFAFLSWGIPLNVVDNSARRYLYSYFKSLIAQQSTSATAYEGFFAGLSDFNTAMDTYNTWLTAQEDPLDPLYGTTRPPQPTTIQPSQSVIQIQSDNPAFSQYNVKLTWINVAENQYAGLGKVDAKNGEVWIEQDTADTWVEVIGKRWWINNDDRGEWINVTQTNTYDVFHIFWQLTDNSYQKITVRGAVHQNYAYKNHTVTTYSNSALNDTDESSFLVPMHYPTVREMSLIDQTQMVTANTFMVFNTYQVTKVRWYQRGIFRIILLIVVVIVSVLTMNPAAAAASGGILGLNTAVGVAVGFASGSTAALIAGALLNAIAAIIVTNIITEAATALFGDKWGAIIGAIVGFVALNVGTSIATNGQLGMDWGTMMRAENIMKLTNVVGDAYSAWANAEVYGIQSDMLTAQQEFETESEEIERLAAELGNTGVIINPMMFTDVLNNNEFSSENPEQFISRTTMVGADIIDIGFSFVYDFAEMNTKLPEGK